MQALIDFDGWRKWKQYADEKANEDPAKKAAEEKEEKAKAKAALKAMFSRPPPSVKKDSAGSTGSSSTSEKASPASIQSTPAKKNNSSLGPSAGLGNSRMTKRSSSNASGAGGQLESMAEEDEKAS